MKTLLFLVLFINSVSWGALSPLYPTSGSGVINLNAQLGVIQGFANDTNVTVTSSNNTHTLGWVGTLALSRGGTGAAVTGRAGGIVYGGSTTAFNMTVAGTSGQVLTSGGAGAPTWGSGGSGITSLNSQSGSTQIFANDTNVSITSSNNTHSLGWLSTLSISRGGTANGSLGPVLGGVVYTDATKLNTLAAGTAGEVLTSNGAAAPSWAAGGGGLSGVLCSATIDTSSATIAHPHGNCTFVSATPIIGGISTVVISGFATVPNVVQSISANITGFCFVDSVTSSGFNITCVSSDGANTLKDNTVGIIIGGT